jgi:hypothetical protein
MKKLLKKAIMLVIFYILVPCPSAKSVVFINEIFSNPPGTVNDADYEFIELLGTPGMKLDGYAVVVVNGTQNELYPLGSIPPDPNPAPEIDEFFSLDGLTLGKNGILVLLMRSPSAYYYPDLFGATRMSDSNWVLRSGLWNGGLDVPNTINNDGSTTIFLIRNRPGITQADPCNPQGLRWGKEILHDAQLKKLDDMNQWGNGDLDEGEPNGLGGNTLDMCGTGTPLDANDDLEIVDEVSFENGQGWEYDTDDRHVDANSTFGGLPYRHVHALDDPANFNPDALSRVDYRTKGQGWMPRGNYGEMANGNNWQDTATEQWIRGRSVNITGPPKRFYYDNEPNSDPNAVQPYGTHVPHWLNDGNDSDYNYISLRTYEIVGGKINPLAVPFIPGDVDRDGFCDYNDIAKIRTVFGEPDWIFANSTPGSTETDSGDPSAQTRPWDVDCSGDNGIEATDLQWVLNFQNDTTGKIAGIKYDSYTPSTTGIYLDSNAATGCTVTTSVNIPSGRNIDSLYAGDIIQVTVKGQVTTGANSTGGHENGIMQYINDLTINSAGVLRVTSIEALGSFSKTREAIETPQGAGGDLGLSFINGYTTSFTQGLAGASDLYRITLQATGEGSANITIQPAQYAAFADSTPKGVKIGHTNSNGNPASCGYPAPIAVTVVSPAADFDGDGDVDLRDFAVFGNQWRQSPGNPSADIAPAGGDGAVDLFDLDVLASEWLAGT